MKVKFTVPGPPQGKGRPRFLKTGQPYTPEKTKQYEKKIAACYKQQCGRAFFDRGIPIDLRITAYFPIAKSDSKKTHRLKIEHVIRPTSRPDTDNVYKVVADACNKLAYYDDSQIVDSQIRKFYSEEPRLVVTIQEADIR